MSLEKLVEIFTPYADKTPERPVAVCRKSKKEYEEHCKKLNAVAEDLAETLYKMVNVERIIEMEAYKRAIEIVVFDYHSEDNQYILEKTEEFFNRDFGEKIVKSGESPKIIDQITKRITKKYQEQFLDILVGFDVYQIIEDLIAIDWNEIESHEQKRITKKIEALPEKHLSELVGSFYSYQARRISSFFHGCIAGDEPDFLTSKLLLQTRTADEIESVLNHFEEQFIINKDADPIAFKQWQSKSFMKEHNQIINQILEGLNYTQLANNIKWIYDNIDNLWQIFADLQGNTHGLMLHVAKDVSELEASNVELITRPFVISLIYHLNSSQFDILSDKLAEKHDIQLTKEFYDIDWNDNALEIFFKVDKSFHLLVKQNQKDIFNTLYDYQLCIAYLNPDIHIVPTREPYTQVMASLSSLYSLLPEKLKAIKRIFRILSGQELQEVFSTNLGIYLDSEVPTYIADLVELVNSGLQHQRAFDHILDYLKRKQVEVKEHIPSDNLIHNADLLNDVIRSTDEGVQEKGKKILEIIQKLQKTDLELLIPYFFEEYNKNLLAVIKPSMSPPNYLKFKILLGGFKVGQVTDALLNENNWKLLFSCSPLEIAIIDQEIIRREQKNLIDILDGLVIDEYSKSIVLTSAFMPIASRYKQVLLDKKIWDDEETEKNLEMFRPESPEVQALEFAYNHFFASWELGHEFCQGPLRNSLLIQSNKSKLTRDNYNKVLSNMEDIRIELTPYIYSLTMESDKDLSIAKELHAIFREYRSKLKILKMLYLIYDQQKNLRERIYEFNVLPRDESLTLLLLDGYDPEELAEEIKNVITSSESTDIIEKLIKLFDAESEKIPDKTNWQGEMYHQVRIRYYEQNEKDLLEDLISLEIPLAGDNSVFTIAKYLYGELADLTISLHDLFENDPTQAEEVLEKKVLILKPAQIERLLNMYRSYYGKDILSNVLNNVKNPALAKAIVKLFNKSETWEDQKLKTKIEIFEEEKEKKQKKQK